MKKKIDDWVNTKWKNPVWSKVIANALWYGPIAAIGAFLLKMWKLINTDAFFRFWELLLGVFTYNTIQSPVLIIRLEDNEVSTSIDKASLVASSIMLNVLNFQFPTILSLIKSMFQL